MCALYICICTYMHAHTHTHLLGYQLIHYFVLLDGRLSPHEHPIGQLYDIMMTSHKHQVRYQPTLRNSSVFPESLSPSRQMYLPFLPPPQQYFSRTGNKRDIHTLAWERSPPHLPASGALLPLLLPALLPPGPAAGVVIPPRWIPTPPAERPLLAVHVYVRHNTVWKRVHCHVRVDFNPSRSRTYVFNFAFNPFTILQLP